MPWGAGSPKSFSLATGFLCNSSLSLEAEIPCCDPLKVLLCDLIDFTRNVTTTNIYPVPTVCWALLKCFLYVNSILAKMQPGRSIIISNLYMRKLRHRDALICCLAVAIKKVTGPRVQAQGYPFSDTFNCGVFCGPNHKKKKKI